MTDKQGDSWIEDAPPTITEESTGHKSKLEKRLLLKMDLSIIPLLACSFFIAYMVQCRLPFLNSV
jgi:hypothetical protein